MAEEVDDIPYVTYYPDIRQPNKNVAVKVNKVLGAIKTGGDFLKTIKEIRELAKTESADSKSQINELKKKLPGISFCGKFTGRYNDAFVEASGLACLDFDKSPDIPEGLIPYAVAVFLSPSGKGKKVLIRIPEVKNDKEYKEYFAAIERKFPTIDKSGKDISRLTYMSYDPDIKLNFEVPVWTEKYIQPALSTKGVTKVQSNYAKMTIALGMIQKSPIGNRHESILKAGKLMGGYIASGEIIEDDVLQVFEPAVMERMDRERDFPAQWKTFTDGIKYGKEAPLKTVLKERKSIKAEYKAEEVYGDMYYTAMDVETELDDLYENGYTKGVSTGWKKMDEKYSILPGYFTILYGAPFTGKSEWEFSLLINLSLQHGWIHCIYSPETGKARDVYSTLIEKYIGKDITNTFGKRMTREEYNAGKKWVNEHFVVLDCEESGAELSIEEWMIYVKILESKLGVKFNTVTGDPVIEFKQDTDVRDDHFWNYQLKIVRVHAKQNNWHVFLVHHITKLNRVGIDDFGNTIYPIPHPSDMAFGQTFYRKGYMILCFYRHVFDREQAMEITLKPLGGKTLLWNSLLVIVQKTKPKGVGKIGQVEFFYDPPMHRYRDEGAYRQEEEEKEVISRNPYKESDEVEWN